MTAKEYKKELMKCASEITLSDDWKKLSKEMKIKKLKGFQKVTDNYVCNTKETKSEQELYKRSLVIFCEYVSGLTDDTKTCERLKKCTGFEIFNLCLFLLENTSTWGGKFFNKLGVRWDNCESFLRLLKLREDYKIDEYGEFDDKDSEDRFKDMLESVEILKELKRDFNNISLVSEYEYIEYYLERVYSQPWYKIGFLGNYELYLVNIQNKRNISNCLKFDKDVGFVVMNKDSGNNLKVRTYLDLKRVLHRV